MRRIFRPSASDLIGPGGEQKAGFICIPRRNSPARSCWPAGEERISLFAHVFPQPRAHGRVHHPEFTMLEWYRAHEPVTRLIEDWRRSAGGRGQGRRGRTISFGGIARPRLSRSRIFDRVPRLFDPPPPISDLRPPRAWATARRAGEAARAGRRKRRGGTTHGRISSARSFRRRSSIARARARDDPDDYPVSEAALARPKPTIRVSPSVSSFMFAASKSPMALAN